MEGFSTPDNNGGLNINLDNVPIGGGFPVLPDNDYLVQFDSFEDKNTKAGGRMINANLTVLGGEFDQFKLRRNFNYRHDKKTVADRALSDLRMFLLACFGGTVPGGGPLWLNHNTLNAALGSELYARVTTNHNGENEVYLFLTKGGLQVTPAGLVTPPPKKQQQQTFQPQQQTFQPPQQQAYQPPAPPPAPAPAPAPQQQTFQPPPPPPPGFPQQADGTDGSTIKPWQGQPGQPG